MSVRFDGMDSVRGMDLDLEKQYSPRQWSKRFPADKVVDKHVESVTAASNAAKSTVAVELGTRYGPGENQLMDIFGGKTLAKDAPMFVFVHGGYWQFLERSISSYCVKPLWKAGIRVIVAGYDLAPKVSLRKIVDEIRELGVFVLKMAAEWGVRSVWFGGHSAGAHLCSMLLTDGWLQTLDHNLTDQLEGLILISGIYDLRPLVHTSVNEALLLTSEEAEQLSPIVLLNNSSEVRELSVLVAVAENDSPAFRSQAQHFLTILQKRKVKTQYLFLENSDHFDIAENLQDPENVLSEHIIKLIQS